MPNLKGAEGFENYYSSLYADRWLDLRRALICDSPSIEWLPPESAIKSYYLDAGSVLAAYCLPLTGAKNILDICAAPGGKSLVLAHRMDNDAQLLCNEISASRRNRLVRVLNEHLNEHIRNRIHISAKNGALMCKHETKTFDRILLDAPCSSEAHVLIDKKYLAQWTPARIKHLALSQWALLSSAFRLLKIEGMLLYATCALSPSENDDVIKKILKKFPNAHLIDIDISSAKTDCPYPLPNCEKTENGFQVLPDTQDGAGPLFFSLIKKISA